MVDPYTFRERLTMPKLLINGANDRYWTLNAIDLYWNGLKGPKYLVELPNAGHRLDVNRDWALNGLGAFFRYQVTGRPCRLCRGEWNLPARKRHVDHSRRPGTAFGPALDDHRFSRDFRDSKWSASPLETGTTITASIDEAGLRGTGPLSLTWNIQIDGIPYHLTTHFFQPGIQDPM